MSNEKPRSEQNETRTEPLSGSAEDLRTPGQQGVSLVIHSCDGVEIARLTSGQPLVLGRREPSNLCIPDRTLSRQHARFTLLEGRVLVEDLDSKNGVWLAGKRIEKTDIDLCGEVMLGTVQVRVFALSAVGDPALEGEVSFYQRLDEEAERAQHSRRSFAILAVRASAQEAACAPIGAWAAGLRSKLRRLNWVSLYSAKMALILLPGTGSEGALQVARTVASPSGDKGASPPGDKNAARLVGVAVYPEAASTGRELVDLARKAAGQASAASPVATASRPAWAESSVVGAETLIVGADMRKVLNKAERVASSRRHVILHGESGTGKEVVARFLHEHGRRHDKRLVCLNCGAIPGSLVESTLFGHEKGSFTGAVQQQRGVFKEADKGTLFLDEIGELPLAAQVALLRVLDTGCFSRVGSTQEVKVDVRVIAATHRDLEEMVKQGHFRQDLYYRLNMMEIKIPPLRERLDVIERFCEHFLEQANEEESKRVRGISEEAMALLRAHRWPGNVRELRNAIEQAVLVAEGELIQPEDLPERVRAAQREGGAHSEERAAAPVEAGAKPAPAGEARVRIQSYKARVLEETLLNAGWDLEAAARQLGRTSRTLRRWIKTFGLKPPNRPKP